MRVVRLMKVSEKQRLALELINFGFPTAYSADCLCLITGGPQLESQGFCLFDEFLRSFLSTSKFKRIVID